MVLAGIGGCYAVPCFTSFLLDLDCTYGRRATVALADLSIALADDQPNDEYFLLQRTSQKER
jgi:hypothetical protein